MNLGYQVCGSTASYACLHFEASCAQLFFPGSHFELLPSDVSFMCPRMKISAYIHSDLRLTLESI